MFKARSTTRKYSKSSPVNIKTKPPNPAKTPKTQKTPKAPKTPKTPSMAKIQKLPTMSREVGVNKPAKLSKLKSIDPNANPKKSRSNQTKNNRVHEGKINQNGVAGVAGVAGVTGANTTNANHANNMNGMNDMNDEDDVGDFINVSVDDVDDVDDVDEANDKKRMSKKRKMSDAGAVKKQQKTDHQFDFIEFIQICRNATTKRALVLLDLQQQLVLTNKPSDDWKQAVVLRRLRISLEDQIAQLGIGINVATFDEQVAPYLELYERHTNDDKTLISMFEAYVLRTQDHVSVEPTNPDVCACGSQFLESVDDALLVCNNPQCRTVKDFLDASTASLAYGDEIEWSSSSYKRMNHLSEWLNHFQARETTRVPDAFVDQVTANLPKNTDRPTTFMDVNLTLRAIGIRNYYDHAMQIFSRITGQDPVRLDPQVEERVRLMFLRIQDPFIKHRPADRKNFLSYPYVIFKILQLLGNVQVLPYLTLLKGKQVLRKQEEIWIKICEDVGWDFIPVPEEVVTPECIDDQDLLM